LTHLKHFLCASIPGGHFHLQSQTGDAEKGEVEPGEHGRLSDAKDNADPCDGLETYGTVHKTFLRLYEVVFKRLE